MTPKDLLESFPRSTSLLPGLSEDEIAQFQQRLQSPIPNGVRQLLLYSAGFSSKPFGTVRFTGHEGFEFVEVFPRSVPLLPDACGNFWIVDINPDSGEWGAVFYACHDPAVIVVQANELGAFVSQILDAKEGPREDALHYVHEEAARQIWKDDPWLVSVQHARLGQDAVLSKFAEQLPQNFAIADLRLLKVGSGFSWGKACPRADLRRYGAEVIFGVEQRPPGFLSRMFSRRRRERF